MKIRTGFVSNSSSSSFIIAVRKGVDLKEKIKTIFALPKNHPLSGIEDPITDSLLHNINDTFKTKKEFETYRIHEWQLPDNFSEEDREIFQLIKDGYIVHQGECESNDDDSLIRYFADHDLVFNDKDIIIKHRGSY